ARRMLICGMHVHAGIEDEELRIDLMNQVSYFLPHLLALSTSSPFWKGEDMGMMSYRMVVFDALPRTGLPPRFDSYTEYVAFVGQLVSAEVIDDATRIWWDARPSGRFPTLEARVFDVCTRLEDAICLAAIYQSLLRRLYRLRLDNQRWRTYPLAALDENRWRAMRYGTEGSLIDFGKGRVVPFSELIDELIDFVREDAEALDCLGEVEHAREIVQRGTSAHRQLHIYSAARQAGADEKEALYALVDHLIEETLEGFEEEAS
ncbi:MAG: YbdK family carboxylate-amine ligase, partial [Alphaproteobacteria bacterium]|nr:YbdK family carboxylate-amine ligase [Alphaproteobacteria bacterium]